LFVVCWALTSVVGEFQTVATVVHNLMEGFSMVNSMEAVTFVVVKGICNTFVAVTAGLVANGVTPHL